MSNKRIQKKHDKRQEEDLVAATGQSQSLYDIRELVVTVPCPHCAHPTLTRRYLPAVGTMNGTVECPRCEYSESYVDALANAMRVEDPLAEPYQPQVQLVPLEELTKQETFAEQLAKLMPLLQQALFVVFGIRRRWRFA